MSLFSRRALQRMLQENARWMGPTKLAEYVRILNYPRSRNVLAVEWEIAVLNGLAKLGPVMHEPTLGGSVLADVHFRPECKREAFIADIAMVSDVGLVQRNTYEALSQELRRHAAKVRAAGIKGGFSLTVGDTPSARFRGAEPVQLKIPMEPRFRAVIFNEGFKAFIAEIRKDSSRQHLYKVKNDEADVVITFAPGSGFSGGSYPYYKQAHSLKKNPVFRALYKKVDQLRKAEFDGPRGIILCDGDCELMRRGAGDWSSYGKREIVSEFLREHKSIGFVLLVTVSAIRGQIAPEYLSYHSDLFLQSGIAQTWGGSEVLRKLTTVLPHPFNTPTNARHALEWKRRTGLWNVGKSHAGGYTLSNRLIKMSARSLLEILAKSPDVPSLPRSVHGSNPFLVKLRNGQLITQARLEPGNVPEEDDEWIVFEFGDPDPAISPFAIGVTKE